MNRQNLQVNGRNGDERDGQKLAVTWLESSFVPVIRIPLTARQPAVVGASSAVWPIVGADNRFQSADTDLVKY